MKYQPFDIVMLRAKYGGRIFAIIDALPEPAEHPYSAIKLDRGPLGQRRYSLNDEVILSRIGTLDPESLKLDPAQADPPRQLDWQIGQQFALYMAQRAEDELDRKHWAFLATLKPGDPIALIRSTARGEYIEQHRFQEVLPNGRNYNFSAVNAKGRVYRWTLAAICLGAGARTAASEQNGGHHAS